MFLAAARALAERVGDEDLAEGALYPPLTGIREVSLAVAVAAAEQAIAEGLAQRQRPVDLGAYIRSLMYVPKY